MNPLAVLPRAIREPREMLTCAGSVGQGWPSPFQRPVDQREETVALDDTTLELTPNTPNTHNLAEAAWDAANTANGVELFMHPGSIVDGRYQLVRPLGRGGMGVVFQACHLFTDRMVAMKILHPWHLHDRQVLGRWMREAQILSVVKHPGVVEVLDAGFNKEWPYLVMELLDGMTLDGWMQMHGPLLVSEALDMGLQVCAALTAIHAHGVVHRDIKPGNIMLVPDLDGWICKIVDFGIASVGKGGQRCRLTDSHTVVGTAEYMPPEQCAVHGHVDGRGDLFSLGVTLFESLTGQVPFKKGAGGAERINVPVPNLSSLRQDVPLELERVIATCLAYPPEERFQDAASMAEALKHIHSKFRLKGRAAASSTTVDLHNSILPPVPYTTPARVVCADGVLQGRVELIDEHGMVFVAGDAPPPSSTVTVVFTLPMRGTLLAVNAAVRWTATHEIGARTSTSLRFLELPSSAKAVLASYVALMHGPS